MAEKRKNNTVINFRQFSPHLFWDIEAATVDFEKNKKWFVQRVLEYGLLKDWLNINKYYGIEGIAEISMKLKDLDHKTAAFISVLAEIPIENFLCYTTKKSKSKHWNF